MNQNNNYFLDFYPICWQRNSIRSLNSRFLIPKGIVIHSTGRNQKALKEYIQPALTDPNYEEWIKQLGKNSKHTDYNHSYKSNSFHFWIGENAAGDVCAIATEPLNIRTWDDEFIHICICEDELFSKAYLKKCLLKLYGLCWILCLYYNWDTNRIIDHSEISTIPDINYWLSRFNMQFDDIRQVVNECLR